MGHNEFGYSLWLDFVERDFLENEFSSLLKSHDIRGATSNPSIFANAITTSSAYAQQLKSLEGKSAKEKYEALAVADIKKAAQILRAQYETGKDGYISIEVDPFLSGDAEAMTEEGKRLFAAIAQPNVMIKVPATEAGYATMRELMSMGISVNATLIFSPDQAMKSLAAIKQGLYDFENSGGLRAEGVISVFVSRFDKALDPILAQKGIAPSRTGILNAAAIYKSIESSHTPAIRTLFASTGVKSDALAPDYYMSQLSAAHAVNTAPLSTLEAYLQNPPAMPNLPSLMAEADEHFTLLKEHGVDMESIYGQLMDEGLRAFEEAFASMFQQLQQEG